MENEIKREAYFGAKNGNVHERSHQKFKKNQYYKKAASPFPYFAPK